jgi:hypothetical protein
MRWALLLCLALLMPAAARAEWHEATSKRFIVYGEGDAASVRDLAAQLEKYDFVLRFATGVSKPPSPTRLKVYVLPDMTAVQRTLTGAPAGVAGYYEARSRGALAVTPRQGSGLGSQVVLFHEYAHHFMFQYFPAAYPSWYSEGFAEYYGMTRFLKDDVVEVGHPAPRYLSFLYGQWLPVDEMLTAKRYADVPDVGMLYAEGWLLVHYLSGSKERAGQLGRYLKALNEGKDYDVATREAFGAGVKKLDAELRAYARKRRIEVLRLPFRPIDPGPIAMRTLAPAEQALIRHDIMLGRGVLAREAADFVKEVRAIVARFPGDAHALSILTEAERAAGNREAAAAAERWLAARPRAARALMHKGLLEIEALQAARSRDAKAWAAARQRLLDAHKADPIDAMVLEAYYDSFAAEGVLAPPGGQNALYRAFELLPQAGQLRYKLAWDFEQRGLIEDAIAIIKPAAYALHDEEDDDPKKKARAERRREKWREAGINPHQETARQMLERLEARLARGGASTD